MKRTLLYTLIIFISCVLPAKVTSPLSFWRGVGGEAVGAVGDVNWNAKVDTIWPARHYRELDGVAVGDQMTKAWIDWKHDEGTVLVYGIHFPKGHVRADAVFKAKSGKHVTFGVRIVHPITGTVVLETSSTSERTTTAEQTMEIMPDTEIPFDGWYRFELTCPDGRNTLERLEVMKFQRTSTLAITDSEIFMAPSVHLWWGSKVPGAPSGQAYDWTYLEALYPSAYRQPATYQMVIGTDVGYSGIQMPTHDDGSYGHSVLFSVWDEGDVEADRNLPDFMRAAAVDVGPGAYATRFGGEGTGSSIRFNDDNLWEFDHWIQFLLNERPENNLVTVTNADGTTTTKEYQSTLQSMWYKMAEDTEWRYIGTLRRAGDSRLTSGIYSFLENFGNRGGNLMRRCYFRNGAMRAAATGQWYALNHAGFGNTQNNGNRYSRFDFGHGVTELFDNAMYLETGGYMGTRDSADTYYAPEQGQMPWVDTIDVQRLNLRVDQAVTHNRAKTVRSMVEATRTVSDPSTWKVIGFSDEETSGEGDFGRAAQILDGSTATYYHNKWKNGSVSFPHTFDFDAGTETTVSSIELFQSRDSGYRARRLVVYTSDNGSSWHSATTNLDIEDSDHPTIVLPEPITSRYFRIRFSQGYGTNLVINEIYFKHEYRLADMLALAQRLIDESDQFGGYAPADLEALRTIYADGSCTDVEALRQVIERTADECLPLTYGIVSKPEHFTPMAVYQLYHSAKRGTIIATADGAITIAGSAVSNAREEYRRPCSVTDPLCNWLLLRSEKYNDYYLYNLGTKSYLHANGTSVSLSPTPTPVSLVNNGSSYAFGLSGKYVGVSANVAEPVTLVASVGTSSLFQLRSNQYLRPDETLIHEFITEAEQAAHEGNNLEYLFQQGLETYAKAFVLEPDLSSRLVRASSNLTSNCNTTQQEIHNLAKIIDRNKNTYYETWYSGISWPAERPYIQAKFTQDIEAFCFTFTPSQNAQYGQPDIPQDIIVSCSPTTRNFLTIRRLNEDMPQTVSDTYTSPILFTDGNARNLRFQVLRTYGQREDSRVWAMSEFQIHSVVIDEEASPYYQRTNVRDAFDALQAQLQATRNLIADDNATPDDAVALRDAIDRAEEALLNTDGIENDEANGTHGAMATWYDLSGRKVNIPSLGEGRGGLTHGVYIRQGSKPCKVIR